MAQTRSFSYGKSSSYEFIKGKHQTMNPIWVILPYVYLPLDEVFKIETTTYNTCTPKFMEVGYSYIRSSRTFSTHVLVPKLDIDWSLPGLSHKITHSGCTRWACSSKMHLISIANIKSSSSTNQMDKKILVVVLLDRKLSLNFAAQVALTVLWPIWPRTELCWKISSSISFHLCLEGWLALACLWYRKGCRLVGRSRCHPTHVPFGSRGGAGVNGANCVSKDDSVCVNKKIWNYCW